MRHHTYTLPEKGLTLVTEDEELREKSREVKVKAINVGKYVKERM